MRLKSRARKTGHHMALVACLLLGPSWAAAPASFVHTPAGAGEVQGVTRTRVIRRVFQDDDERVPSSMSDASFGQLVVKEVQQAGATAPLGYFDPLKLSENKSVRDVKKWREAELKHGRVAMLATVGMLVQEHWTPLFDQDPGPAIHHFRELLEQRPYFWLDLVVMIAVSEASTILRGWDPASKTFDSNNMDMAGLRDDYLAGSLNFDPLKLAPTDEAGFLDMRSKELNNGRLAMIAVIGMIVQEILTEKTLLS